MVMKVLVLCMVAILVAAQVQEAAAADVVCNASELKSCVPSVIGDQIPTPLCCMKLREQVPCFCKYISDPATKSIFGNPKAKKVAAVCGVVLPACPLLVN